MKCEPVKYNNPRNMNKHPRIVAAAVIGKDRNMYSLSAPSRHDNILKEMFTLGVEAKEEGFLTAMNTFVTREVGLIYALDNRQVKDSKDPYAYSGHKLFSEDLW